jgi:hypothetical protein
MTYSLPDALRSFPRCIRMVGRLFLVVSFLLWGRVIGIKTDCFNRTTKYPLKMPMSTALGLVYDIGQSIHPYYNMNGPINNMPLNIHEDWLTRISCFLTTWGKYTMDDFKLMATHHCLLQYGLRENPNARLQQRRIDDFKQFHKKIPSWKAMVDSIRYQKQYNKIDIRTFQAADI